MKLTPMQCAQVIQNQAVTHPTNSEEFVALTIGAGTIMGLHMAGNFPTDEEGFVPMPTTIATRLDSGEGSIDPSADPT
jgi:hypothetical protein